MPIEQIGFLKDVSKLRNFLSTFDFEIEEKLIADPPCLDCNLQNISLCHCEPYTLIVFSIRTLNIKIEIESIKIEIESIRSAVTVLKNSECILYFLGEDDPYEDKLRELLAPYENKVRDL